MSEDIPTLLSIAQIAGVFVGFAALVSVLRDRSGGTPGVAEMTQLSGAVMPGLVVVVAGLIPVVLARYPISTPVVWRLSCAGFLIIIWLLVLSYGRSLELVREAFRAAPVSTSVVWFVLEPIVQIPLVLGMLGFLPSLAPAFYLTALVVNLAQAAFMFSQLVVSITLSLRR
jgi:hypothetical protein